MRLGCPTQPSHVEVRQIKGWETKESGNFLCSIMLHFEYAQIEGLEAFESGELLGKTTRADCPLQSTLVKVRRIEG